MIEVRHSFSSGKLPDQQQAQIDQWMNPVRKITPHQSVATLFIDS